MSSYNQQRWELLQQRKRADVKLRGLKATANVYYVVGAALLLVIAYSAFKKDDEE